VVAKLYSCVDCEFADNVVESAGAGLYLQDAAEAGASGCPGGCAPSRGARFTGNRMRGLDGGEAGASQANIFAAVMPTEIEGFSAGDNVYCVPAGAEARFQAGEALDFAGWQAATMTDTTSSVHAESDPECVGW
jgi:hypothetical protein